MDALKSVVIWAGIAILIIIWLPLLAARRLFDRDAALYPTGRLFRKLGKAISKVNPQWEVHIFGSTAIDDRKPYVIVCNHLSQADIPVISNLPWEMKWVAKKELFEIPVVGWMLKLAGDIPVDRRGINPKISTFRRASYYLNNDCSIIFFPEGTRSRTGKLNRFARGAFELAIKHEIPILPLVIDDTQNCLPKKSWKFGPAKNIKLKVLDSITTESLSSDDLDALTDQVRLAILEQLSEWRGKAVSEIDGYRKS